MSLSHSDSASDLCPRVHRGLPSRYESGQHLELNNDLATVNYQKASDFGSVDGMYNLAMQFLGQEAGGFAHQFGVRYLEKAVDLNHYPARVALAGCMFTGTGRKGRKDPDRAAQLLTDAAVQVILLPQRCARASPPFLPSLQPILFPGSHLFGTVVSLRHLSLSRALHLSSRPMESNRSSVPSTLSSTRTRAPPHTSPLYREWRRPNTNLDSASSMDSG
jgi:hypothetical protein